MLLFSQGRSGTVSLVSAFHQRARRQLGCWFDFGRHRFDWQQCMKTHSPDEAYEWMQLSPDNSRTWVITIVRNAVAARLSDFSLIYYARVYGTPKLRPSLPVEDFNKWPLADRARSFEDLLQEPSWLSCEEPLLGFDPYSMQEPWHPDGYKIRQLRYNRNKTTIFLVLRFEDMHNWHRVFNRLIPGLDWTTETFEQVKTRSEHDHAEWIAGVQQVQSEFIPCQSGMFNNFTAYDWDNLGESSFDSPEDYMKELEERCSEANFTLARTLR
mmetsp:Transcript_44782/g.127889  ORF Transcript_44782/g.127889 Transcript_44782/m.127889 type:complete len:269 (-) Transcript_44782:53-859(-)